MRNYNCTSRNEELYHHGIKGMRWGVRRFQNPDGSLTKAGMRRYGDKSPYEVTTSDGDTFRVSKGSKNNYNTRSSKVTKTWGQHNKEVDDAKANKQSDKPKSKHRQNLEAKYRAMGYDEKHAAERAAKRIKTEKIIAATAGLTVAAASAYVIKHRIEEKSDHIIKSGKTLQRVAASDNINFDRALYMAGNKSDKAKYAGLYGRQLRNQGAAEGAVKAFGIKATKDLKVVSNDKARDTFVELYKTNPEFKKLYDNQTRTIRNMIDQNHINDPRYAGVYKKLRVGMSEKVLRKNGYDSFNRQLTDNGTEDARRINKIFYDALKAKGYDAVADLNDRKYSGYRAKSATIVFGGKGKMEVSAVKKLSDQEINNKYVKGMAMLSAPELAKAGALYVAAPMMAGMTVNHILAEKYRDEHPNTELTDKEIIKMLNEQTTGSD